MSPNKVELRDGATLLDLTGDTVTANTLLEGYTAHDASGAAIAGTKTVHVVRTGTSEPSSSMGSDGDLYLLTEA